MYIVLDSNSTEWEKYLSYMNIDLQDIYYTSDYYKLYEQNGDGKAKLFVYKEEKNMVLYPFMLNEIKELYFDTRFYDIESAYGYGGPITNSYDKEFLNNFENNFMRYCIKSNIVAEFIRFHPLIKNENIFSKNIDVSHNRTTVYLELSKGIDRIWNEDISSKNKNKIRKAEKSNLIVEVNSNYEEFKEIYFKTMDKVNASDNYYFNDKYYEKIQNNRGMFLFNVKKDDVTISSAIFMAQGEYFHYHLSGSRKEYLKFAPNNLLLWEAIKFACKHGAKKFHLGGGLNNNLEDNLIIFKKSFSNNTAKFYIGKRVHNQEVYDYIIGEWEKKNNKKSNLFLQYKF